MMSPAAMMLIVFIPIVVVVTAPAAITVVAIWVVILIGIVILIGVVVPVRRVISIWIPVRVSARISIVVNPEVMAVTSARLRRSPANQH